MTEINDRELAVLKADAESYQSIRKWINLSVKITVGAVIGIFLLITLNSIIVRSSIDCDAGRGQGRSHDYRSSSTC